MRLLRRRPKAGAPHDGPVAFVDGSHYAVAFDKDGNEVGPDMQRRVLWIADAPGNGKGHYVIAAPTDPTHNHLYHERFVEMDVDARTRAELEADPDRPEEPPPAEWLR